jgi:hypothetical protein
MRIRIPHKVLHGEEHNRVRFMILTVRNRSGNYQFGATQVLVESFWRNPWRISSRGIILVQSMKNQFLISNAC